MAAQEQERNTLTDKPGTGIDRTLIHRLLKITPAQRVQMLVREARNLAALDAKFRGR